MTWTISGDGFTIFSLSIDSHSKNDSHATFHENFLPRCTLIFVSDRQCYRSTNKCLEILASGHTHADCIFFTPPKTQTFAVV